MISTDKFYFFDIGIANYLAKRTPKIGTPEFGKSFEHFILLEILNYKKYKNPDLDIRYWRTSTGIEIDFILNDMITAIEVKGSKRIHSLHFKPFRIFHESHKPKYNIIVSLETEPRKVGNIQILPWRVFLDRLWADTYI